MNKQILLIGRKNDPHIQAIQNELRLINEEFILIDSLTINDMLCVENNNTEFFSTLQIYGKTLDMNMIKSVWNSNALRIINDENIVEKSKEFVDKEWTEGIMSMWNTINGTWANHPLAISSIGNRVKQLQIASKLGFTIPETVVTNSPKKMEEFFYKCNNEMICKTLASSQGLPSGKMIFSHKISKQDLDLNSDLKYSPVMFQKYINKKTEFRITIIGNKIHSAEIYSQKSDKTKYDWRNYDDFSKTPYIESKLPDEISEKLLKIMKQFNLNFGACDMIRTPDDEFVFLEINPNGRWWWIQELTQMKIAKSIAKFLARDNQN